MVRPGADRISGLVGAGVPIGSDQAGEVHIVPTAVEEEDARFWERVPRMQAIFKTGTRAL